MAEVPTPALARPSGFKPEPATGRFAIRERRAEVLSPTASRRATRFRTEPAPAGSLSMGGRRWARSTGPSPHAFQTGTTTWWFHLPRRRAGDSNATVLPAHPLANGARHPWPCSPSMSGGPGDRRTARYVRTCTVMLSRRTTCPTRRFELGTSSSEGSASTKLG